jgi:S-formylglutathione hydrolase FrmB
MGGHGALWLAVHHPDVFGAVGCMSGGVDIRPFPKNWEIDRRLGNQEAHPEIWEAHTVINCILLFKQAGLSIIIDCGSYDFFYEVNCNLHRRLLEQNVPHDFIIRPGHHSWEYWVPSFEHPLPICH